MNYVWLGNNEQTDIQQNININKYINITTPIDNLSIGRFFNLLFGVKVTNNVDRIWI